MGFKRQNSRKKAENSYFQVVGSLLYAHYPIHFFLLFEQYNQVLCCVKIQEKVWINKYGFGTFQNIDLFRLFKYGVRVGKGIVKFCHPFQVANLSMLLVQNSQYYVNIMTFESILGVFLFKTGMFQRIEKKNNNFTKLITWCSEVSFRGL